MATEEIPTSFAGQEVAAPELELIREVIDTCGGISRTELLVGRMAPHFAGTPFRCCHFVELPP